MDPSLRQRNRLTRTRSTAPHEDCHQHIFFNPPVTSTLSQEPIINLNLCQFPTTQGRTMMSHVEFRWILYHVHWKVNHNSSRTYHSQISCKQHHLHAQWMLDENGHQRLLSWNPHVQIKICSYPNQTFPQINYEAVLIPWEIPNSKRFCSFQNSPGGVRPSTGGNYIQQAPRQSPIQVWLPTSQVHTRPVHPPNPTSHIFPHRQRFLRQVCWQRTFLPFSQLCPIPSSSSSRTASVTS